MSVNMGINGSNKNPCASQTDVRNQHVVERLSRNPDARKTKELSTAP